MKVAAKSDKQKGHRRQSVRKGKLYRALAEVQMPDEVIRSYQYLTDGTLLDAFGLGEFTDGNEAYQNVAFVQREELLDDAYDHDNESEEIIHTFGGGD